MIQKEKKILVSRQYGNKQISAIGLGLCGLRTLAGHFKKDEAVAALGKALESGINYIDLGFPELCPDKALLKAYGALLNNADVSICVKANVLKLTSGEELTVQLRSCMEAYGITKVTFLQLYGVNRTAWNRIRGNGVLQKADELKETGAVENLSMHYTDDRFYLKPILQEGIFDGISIELSAIELPRNSGSLKIAGDFHLGTVVTGALKNGCILSELSLKDAICAEFFAPGVSSVLLELLTAEEVQKAVEISETSDRGKDYVRAQLAAKKARDAFYKKREIQCEVCRCCMPCPEGFNAPRIAELYNEALMFDAPDYSALQFEIENLADRKCIRCGKCRSKCPREFEIGTIATKAAELFRSQLKEVNCCDPRRV